MANLSYRIPRISDHITTRFLGEEAFIMNLTMVKTYAFNETASRVWSLIDGSTTVDEIIKKMLVEYSVSEDECSSAVFEIIDQFARENLIVFIDSHE